MQKNIGLTGYELPAGVSFNDIGDELDFLDTQRPDWEGAIGEIAKYLPIGASPSESNLRELAYQVAEGKMTAATAADRLSNKKIIIKKK